MPRTSQRWPLLLISTVLLQLLAATAGPHLQAQETAPFDPAAFSIALEPIAVGFDQPVHVTGPDDASGRLFVVERPGRVRIVIAGEILPEPFFDISSLVQSGGSEQGLLSIAFPPDFATSGSFYVYYTARGDEGVGDNTIARFAVSANNPNQADPASAEVLLAVPDFRVNHNGGQLQFGPDGMLYAGFGDGGGGGDREGNAQDPTTLLGSLIRIDPAGGSPYAIPPDNPFADGQEGAPETWVWGLRNPWRFSFDRATGDLWIGDVGQSAREEVTWLAPDAAPGANLGWNIMEGTLCFRAEECDTTGLTLPVVDYAHEFGCSVAGGYVYRGQREPALAGVYLFADVCSGLIWGLGRDANGDWALSDPIDTNLRLSSFGEDATGELYVVDLSGGLFRVTAG